MRKSEDGGAPPGNEQPPMVAEGADKRRSRRRLLRWALGLVPVAAGGGWAAMDWLGEREASANDERPSQRTTWICFAGHRGAYLELDGWLQPPILKPNAPARLMRACLYLEHGSLDAMRRDLVWPEVEHTLEARLLLELAARRSRSLDWRHAFFESWDALGRPDFSKSTLLPEPMEDAYVLALVHDEQPPLQGLPLLTVIPEQEGFLEWGPGQVHTSDSVPLLVALRERLLLLGVETPARQQLLPAVEERLGQLTGSAPPTLQLALRAFLGACRRIGQRCGGA